MLTGITSWRRVVCLPQSATRKSYHVALVIASIAFTFSQSASDTDAHQHQVDFIPLVCALYCEYCEYHVVSVNSNLCLPFPSCVPSLGCPIIITHVRPAVVSFASLLEANCIHWLPNCLSLATCKFTCVFTRLLCVPYYWQQNFELTSQRELIFFVCSRICLLGCHKFILLPTQIWDCQLKSHFLNWKRVRSEFVCLPWPMNRLNSITDCRGCAWLHLNGMANFLKQTFLRLRQWNRRSTMEEHCAPLSLLQAVSMIMAD